MVKGCGIIVQREDGKVLVAKRTDTKNWGGPGGHIEQGETPREAIRRETMEEFGITYLHAEFLGLVQTENNSSWCYVTNTPVGEPRADGKEMQMATWMSLEELEKSELFPPFKRSLALLHRQKTVDNSINMAYNNYDGGSGSGNWGHLGRPGSIGGSGGGGGAEPTGFNQKLRSLVGLSTSDGKVVKRIDFKHINRRVREDKGHRVPPEKTREVLTKGVPVQGTNNSGSTRYMLQIGKRTYSSVLLDDGTYKGTYYK